MIGELIDLFPKFPDFVTERHSDIHTNRIVEEILSKNLKLYLTWPYLDMKKIYNSYCTQSPNRDPEHHQHRQLFPPQQQQPSSFSSQHHHQHRDTSANFLSATPQRQVRSASVSPKLFPRFLLFFCLVQSPAITFFPSLTLYHYWTG